MKRALVLLTLPVLASTVARTDPFDYRSACSLLFSGGQVIGAVGVSGDSSCADHTIAHRIRHCAGCDALPTGILPSDDIQHAPVGTAPPASSSRTAASAGSTPAGSSPTETTDRV